MKQLARYQVLFDSKAIRASSALMGVAIFLQAVYFFVFHAPQEISGGDWTVFLIIPMVLELGWIIMLHNVKYNAAGVFGILGAVICILLLVQACFTGGAFRIVMAVLAYLISGGLFILITGGFVPYKYFGTFCLLIVLVLRFLLFDIGRYLTAGDWSGFLLELAGLCILGGLATFFGGLSAGEKKT